ncbi:MAG: thiol-disulfide isomerase, partial [Bryobacteraceae bacterium]
GGAVEGDPREAPRPRPFTEGWRIGTPDRVVEMPHVYEVPSSGTIEYTYVIVPSGFGEDRWIERAELRPGNRAVMHHASVWIRPRESRWLRGYPSGRAFVPAEQTRRDPGRLLASTFAGVTTVDEQLVGYAPGRPPSVHPAGQANLVPAGADFVFQLHYTPNGKPASDRTRLGLVFAASPPRERVFRGAVSNDGFVIPPRAPSHAVRAAVTLSADGKLVSLRPHMHLRGKAMEIEAFYPTGEKELLLRVPRYDFNWQFDYVLERPKLLPKGTRLEVAGTFDNSANNPANPDPAAEVRWGDQTWEEMMTGQFEIAIEAGADRLSVLPNTRARAQ